MFVQALEVRRPRLERKLDILRDHELAGPLPIWAYLVEPPQGAFLMDTGDRARNSDRDYPPKLNPFFQRKVKIEVAPEEEIGPRLAALGVDPTRDLRARGDDPPAPRSHRRAAPLFAHAGDRLSRTAEWKPRTSA